MVFKKMSCWLVSPRYWFLWAIAFIYIFSHADGRVELGRRGDDGLQSGLLRRGLACVGSETFACNDQRCIPRSWRCDGDFDCRGEEDEKNCNVTCGKEEFQCNHDQPSRHSKINQHACIPKGWRCDGEFDCEDKSDEKDCPQVSCQKEQYTCKEFDGQFTLCIPMTWRCDGQRDCSSGSDEEGCDKRKCDETDFQCANGICIFKSWECDGEDDCGDESDEKNCTTATDKMCETRSMFKCKATDACIPHSWLCDGEADCLDHSDETDCKPANPPQCKRPASEEFACVSGRYCINTAWKCDGEEDCPDGSDEKNCESEMKCTKDMRKCPNSIQCISESSWCNGVEDCFDGADEQNCKSVKEEKCDEDNQYTCAANPPVCVNYKDLCTDDKHNDCGDHTCAKNISMCAEKSDNCICRASYVKGVQICVCRSGFKSVNGRCIDIDECKNPGTCDQICNNEDGGYSCACHPGYKLSHSSNATVPNRCRALGRDPLVLLSNRATIRQFDLVRNVHVPLIKSPGSAVAMDFHLKNGTLIWSDIALQKIFMCKIGNKTEHQHLAVREKCAEGAQSVLMDSDVHTPDGLAIDWIHNLLFWTDGGLDQINVMDLNTGKRRTLFSDVLEEPRAIAVDPEMGLIFWTDWGKSARIERAGMDGQHRTVIVRGDRVKWPNGLALDYIDKRVYWADAKVKSIFSCDYWGHNIKVVLHSHHYLRHPFSLAVFEDRIYYTDWEHDGVITVNKFTGGEMRTVMQKVSTPMTVRIYHEQAQPGNQENNKCKDSGCKDMCLPRAVYRHNRQDEESPWDGKPYACVCQKDTPSDIIECAVDLATNGASNGFSLSTMLFLLMLSIFTVMGFVYYRRRRSTGTFTALNFDNPIYRRTVEAEMDDPFRDPFRDDPSADGVLPPSRLVLADPENNVHNSMIEPMDRPLTS